MIVLKNNMISKIKKSKYTPPHAQRTMGFISYIYIYIDHGSSGRGFSMKLVNFIISDQHFGFKIQQDFRINIDNIWDREIFYK
jgi:hypothetical protein